MLPRYQIQYVYSVRLYIYVFTLNLKIWQICLHGTFKNMRIGYVHLQICVECSLQDMFTWHIYRLFILYVQGWAPHSFMF